MMNRRIVNVSAINAIAIFYGHGMKHVEAR